MNVTRWCSPMVAILAASLLGCAGARNPTGGSMAGTKGTASGEPNGPVGLCMFDQGQGDVRRCLHFAFGRCELFGDPCSEAEIDAQRHAQQGGKGQQATGSQAGQPPGR